MIGRRSCFSVLITITSLLLPGAALEGEKSLRSVHTFFIVAYDPATGEMGVAV